jgi:hypothetical protein
VVLTKEQILSAIDLKTETVEVPEWGGQVKVRMMTGAERDAFEESIVDVKGTSQKQNLKNLRAKLCVMTMVDDNGNLVFTQDEVVALGKKSAKALDRVFGVAQKLNGLTKDDVDVLTKNSESEG